MRAMSIIVCVNQKICEACILITNHTRAFLKKTIKSPCPHIKRSRHAATTPNHNKTILKNDADVNVSIFFKNTSNLIHFTVQCAPYYIHRVFFDTVCPKANHSCSNSNIWTWQKWCKTGSRSHSNLFDKKGWGWGTEAWCMQRQRQKGRFLETQIR